MSDRRLVASTDGTNVDYYDADVTSTTEYYPYGMELRSASDGTGYRYSFQGQEDDPEIKGEGNSTNYKYRMHDPRIGRFFAVDPLAAKYTHLSVYQFSSNSPIFAIELEGKESAADYELYYKYVAEGNQEGIDGMASFINCQIAMNDCNTRILGGVQAGAGVLEMVGGGSMIVGSVGWATVPGIAVVGVGIDDVVAGVQTVFTGDNVETIRHQLAEGTAEAFGADPETAEIIGLAVDLVGSTSSTIAASNKLVANANKLSNTKVFSTPVVADDIAVQYTSPSQNGMLDILVSQSDEPFRVFGGMSVRGTGGMSGTRAIYDIGHVEGKNILRVLTGFSDEAASAGASSVTLRSYAVVNPQLAPALAKYANAGEGALRGWTVTSTGEGANLIYEVTKALK